MATLSAEQQKQYVNHYLEFGKTKLYTERDEAIFTESLSIAFFTQLFTKYTVFVEDNQNNKSYNSFILQGNLATLTTVAELRTEQLKK